MLGHIHGTRARVLPHMGKPVHPFRRDGEAADAGKARQFRFQRLQFRAGGHVIVVKVRRFGLRVRGGSLA